MANKFDIMHRFANKQEGKNGTLTAGNVRYEGRSYYSYSTVFGQWLDYEKNVVVIFDGSTSKSSYKHMLHKGLFPDDVHVFPLDFGGGYSGWNNCDLVGRYASKDEDFTFEHRMRMLDHYVGRIYDQLEAIKVGNSKGLENVSFKAWEYVEELCGLYKDTTIKKYIKWLPRHKNYADLAVRLDNGERDVEALVDYLFGVGTYRTYIAKTERFRKADKKRAQMEALCKRLGIRSPYENGGRGLQTGLTAKQIRNLTAKERLELHWKALAHEEYQKNYDAIEDKRIRSEKNAYKWIVGYEPKENSWGRGYNDSVRKCRNMFTGEEYNLADNIIYGFWWCRTDMSFSYDSFRKAEDKKVWIENFYAEVAEVRNNQFAISILRDMHHGTFEGDKLIGYYQTIYKAGLDEEELNVCMEFIRKCKAHYADEEARARARRIEVERQAAEKAREEAYRKQVKQEQIDECLSRGIEGKRDLWRKHLKTIDEIYDKNDEFFLGGNVLLRLNLNKDKVETSKNIKMPIEVCKKMWKIVEKWHENPSCFKSVEIDTKGSGKYTISSYQNDILTAGCHKIAYCEMERVMNEINNNN